MTRSEQFCASLAALACDARVVPDVAAAGETLRQVLHDRGVTRAVAWADSLVEAVAPPGQEGWLTCGPDIDPALVRSAAAEAEAGITSAAWAVAETGTLALLSGPGRPRVVNLLPPLHVAVMPASRLLPTMGELFAELSRLAARGGAASALHLVTGPSRSADIEDVLVRKVHGPGEVVVILIENA